MKLNGEGRCVASSDGPGCGGTVRNINGKRHTREALTAIHRDTCPAVWRRVRTRKQVDA